MAFYIPQTPRTLGHQQASSFQSLSPTSDYLTQSMISTATTSSISPQTTLLQRWHSLSSEIETRRLSRVAVVELNRYLDKAENLLFWDTSSSELSPQKMGTGNNEGLGVADSVGGESPIATSKTHPTEPLGQDAPEGAILGATEVRIANQASQLFERVSKAAEQLRQRQEDLKHLHNAIITKAEESADKIHQLEKEIGQAEADIADDQSELTYLKLKVRILEIQALPYVPFREKDSLAEGIRRWKLDWADVANRFRTRTRRRNLGKGSTTPDDSFMSNESQQNR